MIEFKSDTPNYYREESGKKSNTVRKVDNDKRFDILFKRSIRGYNFGKIKIIHNQFQEGFIREITDITFWEGFVIISWN